METRGREGERRSDGDKGREKDKGIEIVR